MKHKFECGIVATSHDNLGDQFLAGMMRDEALEMARPAPEEKRLRDLIKSQQRLIAALLIKAGGCVEITAMEEVQAATAREIITTQDHSKMVTRVYLR